MWATRLHRVPKSLSPYAQALKHVALRGAAVALGPSARENELAMYQRGTLPADYRPMVQGKWDDTVERWAYAWQYPAAEGGTGGDEEVVRSVQRLPHTIARLVDFGTKLRQSPPSKTPGGPESAAASAAVLLSAPTSAEPITEAVDQAPQPSAIGAPEEGVSSSGVSSLEASLASLSPSLLSTSVMPVEEFSRASGVPIAYMDDHSEQSKASKELCGILEEAGLDYTEDGLLVAIAAMAASDVDTAGSTSSSSGLSAVHYDAARAIFEWVGTIGLGPHAEMYKALMRHATLRGDISLSMQLIEEMKERGITPTIGVWHELMRACLKAREFSTVTDIVDNMKMYANLEPNEVTFMLQLRSLARSVSSNYNALSEAVQLFDQMENVYGYIAARPHYDAMMWALSQSPAPEMRLRCVEIAKKMEMMGIVWDGTTYLNLIKSAQVVGDVERVEKLLSGMRENSVPITLLHLSWAVQAHTQHLIRLNSSSNTAEEEKEKPTEEKLPATCQKHVELCFRIHELVVQRGWEMTLPFLNALLRLCCQSLIVSSEYVQGHGDETGAEAQQHTNIMVYLERRVEDLWQTGFDRWYLQKDVYSYECYLALLGYQQRIDEAEKCFQVIAHEWTPSRRTYECLIFMHLCSGEEGGAARALHYLEAMEKVGIPVRPALLRKIVRVHNAAGFKRDMKRRARRIMQAREEYLARKEEASTSPFDIHTAAAAEAPPVQQQESSLVRQDSSSPPPVATLNFGKTPTSTLEWWQLWKEHTVSKHELFTEENPDGTPKGGTFEEKDAALAKLGIDSPFKCRSDLPASSASSPHSITAQLKEEGQVAGGIWALDGGELAYPQDGGGVHGWGVRLWRERQLMKRAYEAQLQSKGGAAAIELSSHGNAVRTAGDQVDIEVSGAKTVGELADWRRYDKHRYDDGSAKPASEMQFPPASATSIASPGTVTVWQQEAADSLSPYQTEEELALENDNAFYQQLQSDAAAKSSQVVKVLQDRMEDSVELVGKGPTRRSKYDYLQKWREMYHHGTLDVSGVASEPLVRFGRSPTDQSNSLASTVRAWHQHHSKKRGSEGDAQMEDPAAQLQRWRLEEDRVRDSRIAARGAVSEKVRRRLKGRGGRRRRAEKSGGVAGEGE